MLQIGRNIFSLLVSRILTAIILFLVYTRLIQYLGPEQAGQYGLLAAFLTVFGFFVDLGMQQLVIKKISENRAEAGKYLGNYFVIQFLLGIGFMLILDTIVFTGSYPPLVKQSLYITGIGLVLSSMTMPLMAVINGFQRLSIIARVNFINSLINACMMLLAIIYHKNILFLAFIPGAVALFDVIAYGIIVHRRITPFKFQFDWPFWKQLFAWNLPFMLLTIFSIYNRIDALILPHLRSYVENGYYTAVYKFWDTLAFLPAVVAAALYPYFADKLSRGETEEARNVLTIYTRYMIALAIPLSVGAYFLAEKITVTFFGAAFAPAAPALWLLVAAVSILFIYVPVNSLIISQRTKTATIITGGTLVFNLALNLLLIPKFGFIVAAIVTLASELIQLVGYTIVVQRKILAFPYLVNFVKPIIAGAVMGVALIILSFLNVWVSILAGAVIYGASLLLLGFFHWHDWELLKASINFRKRLNTD
ncbi:MAG: hypothetical protein A3J07_00135 [Candidatus Doudnabacteria bacterium RIFCSPLOWO2_02_FULL_49_13]|uniref:Uncharacterized protein n=1 Tax=Candidatus Doudnabacteria bacterium RIFCSPHIGHO2_12_FULL_48_16 TaxID=1817838 RepID=A0A1F5PIT4_9BACT|nr:MAG: hypothetical protein A3B77_03805 [Candidatus Doudnabacteria bacterium RIFCSPHIGHO2_02_FULL_49_24]OGE88600.1 MAG: hypothetical protein A2760_04290 [Candidatus Doudnabacteria bacterium RIFCSPHIGHO2_01_FULL_50_67]OGE89769.1 MAG: hypothetical protein A3E29_00055 [Candidatus Doudnabacteria bacterium RIFCSPHIGHO2_12_FULL_48_16]OGE96754.1 MAG: hypothetical protein A2990_03065 [Candidatus Doudnabacteria bacterium RIFCSPLOWO2_01_FULL_49_40]OGF02772.1 MAG: hypothetical protein A3J07_00135 [Candid